LGPTAASLNLDHQRESFPISLFLQRHPGHHSNDFKAAAVASVRSSKDLSNGIILNGIILNCLDLHFFNQQTNRSLLLLLLLLWINS
jgi:hypothetical protein